MTDLRVLDVSNPKRPTLNGEPLVGVREIAIHRGRCAPGDRYRNEVTVDGVTVDRVAVVRHGVPLIAIPTQIEERAT